MKTKIASSRGRLKPEKFSGEEFVWSLMLSFNLLRLPSGLKLSDIKSIMICSAKEGY